MSIASLVLLLVPTLPQECPAWDAGFAASGADDDVRALAPGDLGAGLRLFVGGDFDRIHGVQAASIASWDGSAWTALAGSIVGSLGEGSGSVRALAIHDDGTGPALFAAGTFTSIGGVAANNIAKWNGTTWSPLSSGLVVGTASDLVVYDDGAGAELYAGGSFLVAGGAPAYHLARWDGTAWHAVDANTVSTLAVFDDGTGPALYVGGIGEIIETDQGSAWGIARYRAGAWSKVGPGLTGQVNDLAVWNSPGGAVLVAGGSFDEVSGPALHSVAAWNGTSWDGLSGGVGVGPGLDVTTLVEHNGSLVVSGGFESAGGQPIARLARYDGTSWSALPGGAAALVNAMVVHDDGLGERLFLGGGFLTAGDRAAQAIASWDGSAFAAVPASNGAPYVLASLRDFAVHDAGTGAEVYGSGYFVGLGDAAAASVARFDGARWRALAGPALASTCELRAIVSFDDGGGAQLYGAGDFCWPSSEGFVKRWDGTAWQPLPGAPLFAAVLDLAIHDDGGGPALYAATGLGVQRWSGSAWTLVGPVFDGAVHSLRSFDDGGGMRLYAGGLFTQIGASPASRVARWDGSAWTEVGGGMSGPASGSVLVESLIVHDDGSGRRLMAGGNFTIAGGGPASNVASWNGSTWSALGAGTDGHVRALASFDDGAGFGPTLIATGGFANAGGIPARALARWDGAAWSEFGGGLSHVPPLPTGPASGSELATVEIGGARWLWIAGNFTRAGASDSTGLGRYEACAEIGETYCFGDGTAGACPCGNASAPGTDAGCLNSLGTAGALRAAGSARLTDDSLVLAGSGMTNSSALYFQGAQRSTPVPFGDGIKCTSGPFVRLGTQVNSGGASTFPPAAGPAISTQGHVSSPGARHYQVRYRNPAVFCTADTFNYTNAVEIVWSL